MFFRRKPAPSPALDDGDKPSGHRAGIGRKVRAKLARNPMVERAEGKRLTLFLRDNFLSAEECAALCALIDAGARPSSLFGGGKEAGYRTSESCDMPPHAPLVHIVTERIAAMSGLDGKCGETVQGQRYRSGQEYKQHCDYFPVSASYWPRMREQGGQRCWTAMIYLNAVEEGGETAFPRAGLEIAPSEGRILLWNNLTDDGAPNPDSLHAAKPVLRGSKYVLTKWFRERPWTPQG